MGRKKKEETPKITGLEIIEKPARKIEHVPDPALAALPWKKTEETVASVAVPVEWEEDRKAIEEQEKAIAAWKASQAQILDDDGQCLGDVYDQNHAIRLKCEQLAEFLCEKNTSYGGSVFKDVRIMGQVLDKKLLILTRINDKINRMLGGKQYGQENELADLTGYGILFMILNDKDFK